MKPTIRTIHVLFYLMMVSLPACERTTDGWDGVARVGENVITKQDILYIAERDGVSVEIALDTRIEDLLLVQEAERRGLKVDAHTLRRVIVHYLLDEIESAHTASSISESEIRSEYQRMVDEHGETMEVPAFDESIEPIRSLLVRRRRTAALQSLFDELDPPQLFDAQWDVLLGLPQIGTQGSP